MTTHTHADTDSTGARWWLWASLVPIVFGGLNVLAYPILRRFEFGTDEGINLSKALLVQEGYPLYAEVWSDQPPLLTHALATLFSVFSREVEVARFFVLALSCVLLFCCWRIVQLVGGTRSAFLATALLILVPYYQGLSIAVLIGLPALSLGVLALLALLTWHRSAAWPWLVLSAVALAASILTKGFTGILVPVFLVGLAVSGWASPSRTRVASRLAPVLLWAVCLAVGLGVAARAWFPPGALEQLIQPHVVARSLPSLPASSGWRPFLPHAGLIALGFMGSALLIRRRRWLSLYVVGWLVLGILTLLTHSPVWEHQLLLVAVPAAMLAACAVDEALRGLRAAGGFGALSRRRRAAVCSTGVALALFAMYALPNLARFNLPLVGLEPYSATTSSSTPDILEIMARHAPRTRWIVTDRPMYAFACDRPVPPSLAVISDKRIQTGFLTQDDLRSAIREFAPEQILFIRFEWPEIVESLEERYHEYRFETGERLFIRSDLLHGTGA